MKLCYLIKPQSVREQQARTGVVAFHKTIGCGVFGVGGVKSHDINDEALYAQNI